MKIYSSFLIFIFLFTAVSCSAQTPKITDREIIEILFQNDKINNYLHFEINERRNIWVVKNEVFSLDKNFKTNNVSVFSASKTGLKSKNYIEFRTIRREGSKIIFNLYYKIENVEFTGFLIYKDQKWITESVNVLEK